MNETKWKLMDEKPIRTIEGFRNSLQAYVYDKFHIDIIHLMDTTDENVQYIRRHAPDPDARQVLVKNLDELYQDYLGNTMSATRYFQLVGMRYKYLLDEAWKHMEMAAPSPAFASPKDMLEQITGRSANGLTRHVPQDFYNPDTETHVFCYSDTGDICTFHLTEEMMADLAVRASTVGEGHVGSILGYGGSIYTSHNAKPWCADHYADDGWVLTDDYLPAPASASCIRFSSADEMLRQLKWHGELYNQNSRHFIRSLGNGEDAVIFILPREKADVIRNKADGRCWYPVIKQYESSSNFPRFYPPTENLLWCRDHYKDKGWVNVADYIKARSMEAGDTVELRAEEPDR